jgi:hypothetical protein
MAAAPAIEPTVTPAMVPPDNEGAAVVGRVDVDVDVEVAEVLGETAVEVARTLRFLNRLASCVLLKPFFGSVRVASPVGLLVVRHLYIL